MDIKKMTTKEIFEKRKQMVEFLISDINIKSDFDRGVVSQLEDELMYLNAVLKELD